MFFLYLLVRRFLLPINLIERRISLLEGGDFDSTIKVSGFDELAVLSNNINQMVLDMKVLLNQKELLLSDVSHELRSPLAKMRLSLAMIPPHERIIEVEKQIKSLDSLITNILLSDQMATPYSNLNKTNVSINTLINNALELTFVKNIEVLLASDYILFVDSVKLSVAIKNLLENAYKYGDEKSIIKISCIKDGAFVVLSVDDCGPGIPKNMIKKITKAFVRGNDLKKSGFGLGLSICNKVISAHGGSLVITKSSLGGACCQLKIPLEVK